MNLILEQRLNLSSRKRRISAFVIDHFIMTFIMVSITFLALGSNFLEDNNMSRMTTIMLVVMLPGFFLYFAKDSIKGISVGRWIMGIMVRDSNNPTVIPSFGRLFIRNLFLIIWPVEFIVFALSQEKKRLGDKTANAIVFRNPDKPTKLPRIFTLIGFAVAFCIFVFLFAGTAMKKSDAYKVAIKEIEQSPEVLTETGGIKGYGMMPAGSINITNGYGQAQLDIKVLGNERDLNIGVYLIKEPDGEWKLIQMNK